MKFTNASGSKEVNENSGLMNLASSTIEFPREVNTE